jgi:glucokinase
VATTIGVDLGGTKVLAVRMVNNEIVDRIQFSTPGGGDELTPAAVDAVQRLHTEDLGGVGVGVAGLVSWPDGVFVWGPHVAGTHVPVREALEGELGLPVVVDNDANMAAWGEIHLGAAKGLDDVLLVTLGTGIGGAVVIDGRIHRGASFAGEWGHTLYDSRGPRCDCGKIGCWETAASGPALLRLSAEFIAQNPEGPLAHELGSDPVTAERVTRAADAGFESARSLVAQVGADLGRGLCNLIAIFDPDMVVVGGGLGSVGESILGPARRVAADALHGGAHRMLPPILVAGLGPAAGAVGAALMAEDLVTGRLNLGSS